MNAIWVQLILDYPIDNSTSTYDNINSQQQTRPGIERGVCRCDKDDGYQVSSQHFMRCKADGRLTERDKIKMAECFRLGDIVKAKVVS